MSLPGVFSSTINETRTPGSSGGGPLIASVSGSHDHHIRKFGSLANSNSAGSISFERQARVYA